MSDARAEAPPAKPAPGADPSAWRALGSAAARPLTPLIGFVGGFGEHMLLLGRAMAWLFRRPFRPRLFFDQMEFVGVGSLPIVVLVGFFSGAVTALQALAALEIFQQERWVGVTVGISLAQELAPVFTALMITARAGSGMATELGSMRITEQIDALTTFAVSPVQYLVTPRVIATVLMLPVLTMVFNVFGLFSAYLVAIVLNDVDFGLAADLFRYYTDPRDYVIGLIKATVFGLAVSLSACFQGFNVRGGAKEVGMATTRAVVSGSVSILVLDYFLTMILRIIWPFGE